jgi:hypothetical protein
MVKHIPTLTLVYYKENDQYTYQYDDKNGNTQENGMFLTIGDALKDAAMLLKTFTYIGVEEK